MMWRHLNKQKLWAVRVRAVCNLDDSVCVHERAVYTLRIHLSLQVGRHAHPVAPTLGHRANVASLDV